MHPLTQLAKNAVESYVRERHIPSQPDHFTDEMSVSAGVFVCLKKDGKLRGCVGTFLPVTPNVAMEITMNAVNAASRDPRFEPVLPDELPRLEYTVDVLTVPEPVKDPSCLDPKKYGVIVTCGERRGLLLPDLDGVDTVNDQLAIACRKAGIKPSESLDIECFEVKRYT